VSQIAFHENAGGCQVNFAFVFVFAFVSAFLRYTFLPSGEILQSSPERSRARLVWGAAQRTLDGEDRSEMMDREGKPCVDSKRFLKREQARWDALNVCQPWFYLRLVAYGFFRLSEGA